MKAPLIAGTVDDRAEDVLLAGYFMDGINSTIRSAAASSPAECLKACSTDSRCNYAVYFSNQNRCELKTTASTISRRTDTILLAQSYQKFARIPDFSVYGDVEESGFAAGSLFSSPNYVRVGSEEACVKLCKLHPTCNVANWYRNEGLNKLACILRIVLNKSNVVPEAGVVSFVS